ncbi:S-methyl-5-thioribose kinase [Fusobacterium nucleatum]|uniref:S-methyl-5-thioribose kinase n=1 Tax=Fusobacterium nucleatum subsp. nucleatum TaxID=76856 RepID=A0A0M5M9Z2_FUSNC|nr:S-methyl-5-thioribose kinase [Fusobacterium nucleatum]ALF22887.1 5-methylthioribose kinase [Fusobacterium nucleatum subsp. nucleatum ChDC F316]ALF25844.1 5-methylthioribose kinase [Fusobacterium nucleatum subsp. nucleatum]ASG25933.1 S-methyl-5-thioribose kinase [Fusobacterium nucleatum subsp. nucleatum]KUL99274.1 5-methylthioribose kinase [Fusobacterium nucleatum subsp. nucleatum]MCG6843028.1 S-methyl-5-thioribose kinase [Fusobacterium nucleatum]
MKYQEHFLLDCDEVISYVKEKNLFQGNANLTVKEIGDGNINYIFKVENKIDGKSIILKQADKLLRSSGRPLDLTRSKIEANILRIENNLAPHFVPEIYFYDEIMCVLAMEDISEYKNLRTELIAGKIFPNFVDNISEFLSRTLLLTTDLFMNKFEKKKNVKEFTNPELCDISECLVFTEPYDNNRNRNIITAGNEEFVENTLYKNEDLHFTILKLREKFMNYSQSLIHGDLHSGSIFINEKGIKIIDPEFSFYGPMAYDIGNVIGNLYFPLYRAKFFMEDSKKKEEFINWLEKCILDIPILFSEKCKLLWEKYSNDKLLKNKKFRDYYIENIVKDSLAYAGTEMIRRTVGDAKVLELTSLENSEKKLQLEKELISKAVSMIMKN